MRLQRIGDEDRIQGEERKQGEDGYGASVGASVGASAQSWSSFDVIVPSMPGFGLSRFWDADRNVSQASPTDGKPFTARDAALVLARLARRLRGAEVQYWVQGGDWGAIVGTAMAQLDPAHCRGLHVNFYPRLPLRPSNLLSTFAALTLGTASSDLGGSWKGFLTRLLQRGDYMHAHVASPDTLGTLLASSPRAAFGYVVDKFERWSRFGDSGEYNDASDDDDDNGDTWNDEDDSTDVLHHCARDPDFCDVAVSSAILYVTTHTMSSSLWFYRDTLLSSTWWMEHALRSLHAHTSLCLLHARHEPFLRVPQRWATELLPHPLLSPQRPTCQHLAVGHFAALEAPTKFLNALFACLNHHAS
jgi:pimeloyl-ACP methyl ester carboxylesterase